MERERERRFFFGQIYDATSVFDWQALSESQTVFVYVMVMKQMLLTNTGLIVLFQGCNVFWGREKRLHLDGKECSLKITHYFSWRFFFLTVALLGKITCTWSIKVSFKLNFQTRASFFLFLPFFQEVYHISCCLLHRKKLVVFFFSFCKKTRAFNRNWEISLLTVMCTCVLHICGLCLKFFYWKQFLFWAAFLKQ